jgi:hypothetical protein
MWQEERTTMWCVRACDASSQQYLEEETGYGQADCSIIPGTRELHGPASHWTPSAICARQPTQIRKEAHNRLVP